MAIGLNQKELFGIFIQNYRKVVMVLSLKNYRNRWLVIGLNEKEFFKIFIQTYRKMG